MSEKRPPRLSAWRFVVTFGTVSLLADFVYEGARSVTGPVLALLGACSTFPEGPPLIGYDPVPYGDAFRAAAAE